LEKLEAASCKQRVAQMYYAPWVRSETTATRSIGLNERRKSSTYQRTGSRARGQSQSDH
jgi:hypothetical protein